MSSKVILASSAMMCLPLVTINGLINPGDTSVSGNFSIITYYSSDEAGVTQSGSVTGVTATVGVISISTVSVVPSSYLVLDSGVTYTVTFNNTYLIPQDGSVVLEIPTDITLTSNSLTTYTKFSIDGANMAPATSQLLSSAPYQIKFSNIAQSGPIPAGSMISLQIADICKNPTNTRIISPFAITTYSVTSTIETLSGLTVQMTNPAAFFVFTVTRASDQNSVLTSYTFRLRQEAELPIGTLLLLTLPPEIAMTSASTCTDLVWANITCSYTSFQDLTVTLPLIATGT